MPFGWLTRRRPPFLLAALVEVAEDRSLRADRALIVANARVAAALRRKENEKGRPGRTAP
jgi:pseudouridine-5'-phosphate glycosidase